MVEPDRKRAELRKRLMELESELEQAQREFVALGPGEALPGLFLVVEISGHAAAIPASCVVEIVRLVECSPLPQAPAHVLGTFLYRGEPVLAVDPARYLGSLEEPRLDAHLVVLNAGRPVALVVDRVRMLVEAPTVAAPGERDGRPEGWFSSPLVAGLCRIGSELVPLLRPEPLLEGCGS
jgi:purine-binding chemotaxis protein CheW